MQKIIANKSMTCPVFSKTEISNPGVCIFLFMTIFKGFIAKKMLASDKREK